VLVAEPKLDSQSSQARRIAVNAAFLREIKDDNRFLDELLVATRDALTLIAPLHINIGALLELLRRLRDRLAMHFSLEEAFGYCDNALDCPVERSVIADAYRNQHASLYLDVCDIVEAVERLLYHESTCSMERSIQRVSFSFACFCRRMQQHDAGENELVDAVLAEPKGGTSC
jgi:hypothetical protein